MRKALGFLLFLCLMSFPAYGLYWLGCRAVEGWNYLVGETREGRPFFKKAIKKTEDPRPVVAFIKKHGG